MKVLVVGSGGREHALCCAFKKSQRVAELYCANGNAGIAEIATCVDIHPDDIDGLGQFASTNAVDLTFVGGETSLALGIVDELETRGLRVVGPGRHAAQLESSKAFAKDFMARHSIPTAKYVTAHSPESALLVLEGGDLGAAGARIVVKADGLAGGKGVVVAANRADAGAAITGLCDAVGSQAASKIVLEECLKGSEVSLLAFVSGEQFALMPPVRDHKRIGDGDTGPNTGGMGTFTDDSILSLADISNIVETIVRPTLHGCVEEGLSFNGILFVGLMMTPEGPRVLEYNMRFGDPETQAILVRLETDIVDICEAMLEGRLDRLAISWRAGNSACVVLASEGYPARPRTGDIISGLDDIGADIDIFHAGTLRNSSNQFTTAAGRVLGVTSTGVDLHSALNAVYSAAQRISWPGMQYRRDIGNRL